MPFPVPLIDLDGQRVLLIGVVLAARRACFVTGTAQYTGAELRVNRAGGDSVVAGGTASALQGFDPAVLPRLIVPEHRGFVLSQAAGVVACVVAAIPAPFPDAIVLDEPFFGLAMNGETGDVFLMQVDDSEDEHEDNAVTDHNRAT